MIFWKDRRTREHEKKCKGLLEQNENKRFGWALPNTPFLRFPHLNHLILHFSLFVLDLNHLILHSSLFVLDLNHWILHSSFFTFPLNYWILHSSLFTFPSYSPLALSNPEASGVFIPVKSVNISICSLVLPRLSILSRKA